MTTELEEQPLSDAESATSSWAEAMKAAGEAPIEKIQEKEPEPKQEVKADGTNGSKPDDEASEFPTELTEGKKPEPLADPDEIFNEVPKGQVKHEHFTKVQTAAKERVAAAKVEAETLRAEIAKMKTEGNGTLSSEHTKTIADLTAERDAMRERLGQSDYARTPEFEAKFTNREKQIRAQLEGTADAAGVDKESIVSLVNLPLKKHMEILDGLEISPSARSRVDALLVRYDELQSDKATELSDWKANAAIRQQQNAAQEQAKAAADQKTYEDAFEEVSTELFKHEPFRIIEGQEKWNATAKKNQANALEIINGNLSPKAVVRAAIHAAGYETLLGMYRHVQGLARDRGAELAKLKSNSPTPGNSAPNGERKAPASDAESSLESWNLAHRG